MFRYTIVALVAMGLLTGCTVQTAPVHMPPLDDHLVSGVAIFEQPVRADEAPAHDVLGVTPEMVAFVGDIGDARLSVMRFSRLLDRLQESGFFDNHYNAAITHTAAETFAAKVGNCISYTNLFVALARLAGLSVHYQLAEVQHPTWNAHTGILIRNNHVNVLVNGARFNRNRAIGHTIDFNVVDPDVDAKVRQISDAHAESLFYANLSVDSLLAGQERRGFAYLRRALETAPTNADLWINLGAFYSRYGAHEEALASYAIARRLKPSEKLILSGLERSHRALGNVAEADRLARQVQRYRLRNPYYHFALAQSAYEAGLFSRALTAIRKAQGLKRRVPGFHYMESLVLLALNDKPAAARSLSKARRYDNGRRGGYSDLVQRYGNIQLTAVDASGV